MNSMIECFEKLRMFSDYRTPANIRSFCKLVIVLAGIFTGPLFAHIMLQCGYFYGYFLCVIFFWMLCCMSNIQVCLAVPVAVPGPALPPASG